MTGGSSSGRWWSRLGFGSVPGDPEESRAFLQKRIALFLGISCLLWSVLSAMGRLAMEHSAEIAARVAEQHILTTPVAVAVLLGACWVFLRSGERPLWVLNAMDAVGTLKQTAFLAVLLTHALPKFRPEMNIMQGVTFLMIARAAIVPSNATRTFVIGVLASVPFVVSTFFLYEHAIDLPMPRAGVMIAAVAWTTLGVLLSTTISRVIYGLHRRVQEASRLGQYVLERKLGEGGMGIVYLAKHAMLRRPTAVKLLPSDRAGRQALARFEREVQLTSTLSHPNTIAIYDYGRTPDGLFYYAMEYLDGLDLERVVSRTGALPPSRVVHIIKQVAAALEEAHDAGLVHRDIKPSNIVLCNYGRQRDFAKVLDFGLVRQTEAPADPALSGVQALTGTPLYMSPEAIADAVNVDGRTDVYALGAVAYFLVTGERVFDGDTVMQVCGHHLFSAVAPPSERLGREVPAKLERIILDCLAKDRNERVQSASALLARLETCEVAEWTSDEAREWWAKHGPELEAKPTVSSSEAPREALTVDLAGRR